MEAKVQLDVFEGPLDLLLYLVRKEEVDIYDVNLTKIATQFIEYIELMRQLDLEVAGEFVVMAATLMYIKSRELLPIEKQALIEEDDEGEDPRWELIRQLVEYKKFKDVASRLQEREGWQENLYPRNPRAADFKPAAAPSRLEVSVFDLINAVNAVLKRFNDRDVSRDVFEDRWTVSEKIEDIRNVMSRKPRLRFSELFESAATRSEVVVTFLALLELIRLRSLQVSQSEPFSEIEISLAPTSPATQSTPAPPAEPEIS